MKIKFSSLYLKIAEIIFEIKFKKIKKDYLRKIMRNSLYLYYKGNVIKSKPERVDYLFTFVDNENIQLIYHHGEKKYFVDFYRKLNDRHSELYYYISPFQFQWLFTSILSSFISDNGGLNLHASSIRYNNKIYLFLGAAGSGKSTILHYLKDYFVPVAEDTNSIIKKEADNYYYYQGPLIELPGVISRSSKKYSLGKLFFLIKSDKTRINKLTNHIKARKMLAKQIFTVKHFLPKQYRNTEIFVQNFNDFYLLEFRLNKKELIDEIRKFL